MSSYRIHSLPVNERPREKLQRDGHEALSNAELIAVLLGSGTRKKSVFELANEIVFRYGSLKNLSEATVEELCQIHGLGKAKAVLLKAAFGLGIKLSKQKIPPKYHIETARHAYCLVKDDLENRKQEAFITILLDAKGCALSHHLITLGTLTDVLIHPREVFYPAIRHKAVSIIGVHNHPSGDPTPSEQDVIVTQSLVSAGKLLHIPVSDHIIIGEKKYVSLRESLSHLFN